MTESDRVDRESELAELEQMVSLPGWRYVAAGLTLRLQGIEHHLTYCTQDELPALQAEHKALKEAALWPHTEIDKLRRLLAADTGKKP